MKREADKDLKTSVPAVPLCEILPLPEITKDTEEGSSQSVEKPLCTPCLRAKLSVPPMPDLPEITKTMEREADKDSKTSVPAEPLCEILPLPEIAKDTERGAVKALKNLCALCASVRNSLSLPRRFQISRRSQRTRRGEQSKR